MIYKALKSLSARISFRSFERQRSAPPNEIRDISSVRLASQKFLKIRFA